MALLEKPRTGGPMLETRPPIVHLLEADPELGTGIDPDEWAFACRCSAAPVFGLERGPWRFFPSPDPGGMGALLLEGLVMVRVTVGPRSHLELLGEGDVISPWSGMGDELAIPSVVTSQVLSNVRIALLTRSFTLRTGRWPEIHGTLMQRLIARARRASLQSAINGLGRVEERLELTLWQLAQRWGRVTPQGVRLHLPLTHAQLAEVVAAQRPSVSTAVNRMEDAGRLVRRADHELLLCHPAPARLEVLTRQCGLSS